MKVKRGSTSLFLVVAMAILHAIRAEAIEVAHIQSDSDVITHVAFARVKCGGLVSLDSLHPNMPGGRYESAHLPYYPVTSGRAGSNYVTYEMRSVSVNFARLVEDSLHTSITNVILFEVDGSTTAPGGYCDVQWDPRLSWLSEVETSSLSLAVLESTSTDVAAMCQSVQVTFNGISGAVTLVMPAAVGVNDALRTSVSLSTLNTRLNNNGGFPIGDTFPATILAPPQCKVIIALLATHYGKYSSTVRWLPLTIYSALFLPLIAVVGRKGVYAGTPAGLLTLGLTFIGYAGSCVGVGIELATWTYPLHPFPFPGAVTMFVVAAVIYGFIIMLMLWGHPLRVIATHAGFNMLLYGLSIGLMVGYFMRAFLIIGILAVLLIGLLNFVLIILTVYFATRVPRSFRAHTGSQHALSFLAWFPLSAPVVPVTYFALQLGWTGYQQGAGGGTKARLDKKRLAYTISTDGGQGTQSAQAQIMSQLAIVDLHSILSSVLVVIIHNLSTLALLLAACIYHTPFVVALFPVLCLMTLHMAFTMQEYTRLWRHFGEESIFLSLNTAIIHYARQEAMHRSPSKNSVPNSEPEEMDIVKRSGSAKLAYSRPESMSPQPQGKRLQTYYDEVPDIPPPGFRATYVPTKGRPADVTSAGGISRPSGIVTTPKPEERAASTPPNARISLGQPNRISPNPVGVSLVGGAQQLTSPPYENISTVNDGYETRTQRPVSKPPTTFRTVASLQTTQAANVYQEVEEPRNYTIPSGISGRSGSAMLAAMRGGY